MQEAENDSHGIVGMNRGKNQVAGESCLNRYLGGLGIPYFAYQDDIGVEAHYRSQATGKGEFRFGVDLGGANIAELILHRVFDSDNFSLIVI